MTIKQNRHTFLILHRNGKIVVRVSSKRPPFEHEITTECATVDAAAGKAELNRCLNEALKLNVAAQAQAKPCDPAEEAPVPPPPAGSFLFVLDEMFSQLSANRWADNTIEGFLPVVKLIKNPLPRDVQYGPIEKVTYDNYKVLAHAINSNPKLKESKYQVKQNLRRFTEELVRRGLPRECLDVVDLIEAKSSHAKRGKPNSGQEIL